VSKQPSQAQYDDFELEHDEPTVEAYIGAELYSQRMFPSGCPSFQKAQIKLYRIDDHNKQTMIDSQYFHNKEGFGYMLKKLPRGNYQIQVKKYSSGFDVYDFTARIYAPKSIKMVDVE